nr:hypothetical protein [uncultured Draconibacterium sp.]
MGNQVDLAQYDHSFSLKNKIGRLVWNISYWILFRPFGSNFFKQWRNLLLKVFGAKIGKNAIIYASARIWAPWNLELGKNSGLGPKVDCYNQGRITIGENTVISQKAYLCASTHDFRQANFPLILKPIEIGNQVWVAAEAFIGPGVKIEEGAIVAARSAVFLDVSAWSIVRGNPAVFLKERKLNKNKNAR